MKNVFGLILIVGGIALGLCAGLWWAFIGGIVDVITEIRAADLSALNVAIGIAKVLCAGLIGWLSAMLLLVPGYAMLKAQREDERRPLGRPVDCPVGRMVSEDTKG